MRYLAALIVALALLAPSAAVAQDGNPFDGQLPPAQQTPAPTAEPVDNNDDEVSRTTLYVIGGGLLVFFIGIGWWISRDARSNLPQDEREDPRKLREEGPHKHARQNKAKARAKGRAQRQARKKSRR